MLLYVFFDVIQQRILLILQLANPYPHLLHLFLTPATTALSLHVLDLIRKFLVPLFRVRQVLFPDRQLLL